VGTDFMSINVQQVHTSILNKKIDITDILIVLFILGSVVLDPGDNLLRFAKVLFIIPCTVYILKSQKLYFDTYVKWMLGFAVFAGLSFFWAISITNAAYRYQTLVINLICIYCLLVYIKNRADRINLVLKTLFFAPIILEIRVIMLYGLFAFQHIRNLDGIMSSNLIGMRAGIAVVIGTYYLITEKKHRIIYLLVIWLNAMTAILSGSRKAVLFMLIPLILYYIFRQKNSLKFLRNAVFSVVLVGMVYYAILNIPFVYDMVGYRIETMIYGLMGTGETDGSTSLRLKMIAWGLEWFMIKPWFGYGINNYMTLLGTMHTYAGTTGVYAHNNYIEMLVNLGVIGTAIYYFIYLKMLEKAVRIRKRMVPLQLIMVSILLSIIINEYGMVTYIDICTQIILVLTWMLLIKSDENVSIDGGISESADAEEK
jgi:O-antigen ligase